MNALELLRQHEPELGIFLKKLPAPDHKEPDADSGCPYNDNRIDR
jgi:hypothetical protein